MITDKIKDLNPMQREAVLNTEGPLLILAGAGSGKTRVLTHRIAYLTDVCGVRAFNILAITFTNKAAREMKERVEAITESGSDVWVSTFHSTCVRILRREIERLGYSSSFTIYDADDSERLIKEILKILQIDEKNFKPKYFMSEIGKLKDELITPEGAAEGAADFKSKQIAQVYMMYRDRLKASSCLDFDDLIFKTVELFAKHPDVLEKYQDRFRYIMVDEYQDTNTSQYRLIRLLSSKYGNLCVVGDDDQSIYGWRGANIRNILDFEKDFENAKVIKLEQNYRSTKAILEAANAVIKNNCGRKAKSLWTENRDGEKISYNRLNSDLEEAAYVSNEIKKKIEDGGAKYGDFAVLYRNNALSRVIEERLVLSSLPYRLVGAQNFYGRKEIRDILAYLKIICNPNDDMSFKRIINVPKRGIGDTTVDRLSAFAAENGISFYRALSRAEEIDELKRSVKKLSDFYKLTQKLSALADSGEVSELINSVLYETNYMTELELDGSEEALGRIENIQELINKAVEYEDGGEEVSLAGFLEEVSLVADTDTDGDEDNRVTLMTLHSSKGLEFPYVFLIGFEEGIFPTYRSTLDPSPNAVEEERRLCYVGITRAKEQLYITCSKTRLQHGQYVYNSPSRFLKEIPREYLDAPVLAPAVSGSDESRLNSEVKTVKAAHSSKTAAYKPMPAYTGAKNSYKSNIPAPKNVTLDFKEGDTVRQMKYGRGVVKKISPAGADFEVTVEFENAGEKKLMAMLARLKKV